MASLSPASLAQPWAPTMGFRGELDIAFDARPEVYAGNFQQVTDLLP